MNYVSHQTPIGQWQYPFLRKFKAWGIVSSELEKPEFIPNRQPVLRYVKDTDVKDLYIPGDNADEFLSQTGLTLSMDKGGFVLSKRISRIMRPYLVYGFVSGVRVLRLQPDESRDKVWDGAGVISRKMLRELYQQRESSITDKRVRRRTKWEIETCNRVEFTYMSELGQEKGHAIVSDELTAYDLIVPDDIKTQIKFNGEFLGINFVHGKDHMNIDIQSMVNLNPFFSHQQYESWLADEGHLFVKSVESGDVETLSRKIDGLDAESLTDWFVMKYFASQGKMNYFSIIVRSIFGQHLKRLNNTTMNGMRLPVHGGRYYVMPDHVGQAAGKDISVERSKCVIDKAYATMWVNSEDWVEYIADVAGGADNDDAFWIHPFKDYDDKFKFLAWRSPNQQGEYLIFEAQADTDLIAWERGDESDLWTNNDSRLLPKRIDRQSRKYLGLVGTEPSLGKDREYSIDAMSHSIEMAVSNAGTLGFYCNMMLISIALDGKLPDELPAPLEDVIDSSVKTGADVSAVKEWCQQFRDANKHRPTPYCIKDRLDEQTPENPEHWLTDLEIMVKKHIEMIATTSEILASQCQPPMVVMEAGKPYRKHGRAILAEYSRAFKNNDESSNKFKDAHDNVMAYLEAVGDDIAKGNALLGAIYYVYTGRDTRVTDTAIFCGEEVSELALNALRRAGALADIHVDARGELVAGNFIEPIPAKRLVINGVWFNTIQARNNNRYDSMSSVPKQLARDTKDAVLTWADEDKLKGKVFDVELRGNRQVLVSNNRLFGFIAPGHSTLADKVQIEYAGSNDGNLTIVVPV